MKEEGNNILKEEFKIWGGAKEVFEYRKLEMQSIFTK